MTMDCLFAGTVLAITSTLVMGRGIIPMSIILKVTDREPGILLLVYEEGNEKKEDGCDLNGLPDVIQLTKKTIVFLDIAIMELIQMKMARMTNGNAVEEDKFLTLKLRIWL